MDSLRFDIHDRNTEHYLRTANSWALMPPLVDEKFASAGVDMPNGEPVNHAQILKHLLSDKLRSRMCSFMLEHRTASRFETVDFFSEKMSGEWQGELKHPRLFWGGLVNHILTRAQQFAKLDSYVRAGVTQYQIRAILDHRTTEFERRMHERTFKVEDGIRVRNQLLAARNLNDVNEVTPLFGDDSLLNAQNETLVEAGFVLPPFVWGGRTDTFVLPR